MAMRTSKAAARTGVLLLALAASPAARAQTQAPFDTATLRAMSLAGGCAQCHGTNGRAPPGATAPSLAGMPAATFLARLGALRRGPASAASGVMRRIAAGYSDAQLRTLAAYFAAQPP